jgi:ribose transport system permease protein
VKLLSRQQNTLVVTVALLLLMGFYAYKQPLILSPFGLRTIANQGAALALAAIGQLSVILTAGVDLSLGAVIALTNCVAARLFDAGLGLPAVVPIILLIGMLCGAFNGIIIARLRLQPIIVTLATSFIYSGLSLYVLPAPGGSAPDFLHDALTGSIGWLPKSLLLLAIATGLIWRPILRTRLGQGLYCVGDNESGAFLSGIRVVRVKVLAYGLAGLFAALAGLFLTAETTSGDPGIGATYTLGSIAAAVLGGAALAGGRGSATGAIISAFVISILIGVLFAAGISSFYLNVFQGGILLAVLIIGRLRLLRASNWLHVLAAD